VQCSHRARTDQTGRSRRSGAAPLPGRNPGFKVYQAGRKPLLPLSTRSWSVRNVDEGRLYLQKQEVCSRPNAAIQSRRRARRGSHAELSSSKNIRVHLAIYILIHAQRKLDVCQWKMPGLENESDILASQTVPPREVRGEHSVSFSRAGGRNASYSLTSERFG
jgi:hypothetical protein